ncbi:MAG: helix-turn-helix domain-containing protein [Bacteroidota bacterium]
MPYLTAFLFLLTGIGVLNGLLVSSFLLFKRTNDISDKYLGALLLVLCIRIGKSVFYYFDPGSDKLILQIGLSACLFIGPLFAFYLRHQYADRQHQLRLEQLLLLTLLVGITIVGIVFPYRMHSAAWNSWIIQGIYGVWLLFVGLGTWWSLPRLRQIWQKRFQWSAEERSFLVVLGGILFITATYQCAYYIHGFTYIWGALLFTGFFYYFIYTELIQPKKRKRLTKNNVHTSVDQGHFNEIERVVNEQQLYQRSTLKLEDLAQAVGLSPHEVSRILNTVYAKGFAHFINEKRIEKAKASLVTDHHLSLEGIGYEAGFNSKSSFFATFKKMTGQTPAQYKRSLSVTMK